jgi:integral membrane protein
MFATPRKFFRFFAVAEVISWTLLIGGIILRATQGWDLAVTIGGGIHGFVFLAYALTAVLMAKNQRWAAGPSAVAIISAGIPYATIPVDLWLHRTGRLEGNWRRTATDDPRDHTWHDRLLRWVINHPGLSILIGLAAVVVVYIILLLMGPPV